MAARLRVVDTSAWIEWLTGSALGQQLGKQLPTAADCIVPTSTGNTGWPQRMPSFMRAPCNAVPNCSPATPTSKACRT